MSLDFCINPTSLEIDGYEYELNTSWIVGYKSMCALEDNELTEEEKFFVIYELLFNNDKPPLTENTASLIMEYLGGGGFNYNSNSNVKQKNYFKWSVDYSLIFQGIAKVLGYSPRANEELHWWDFLLAFGEVGECMFSNIVRLREGSEKNTLSKEEKKWIQLNSGYITAIKENNNINDLDLEMLIKAQEEMLKNEGGE